MLDNPDNIVAPEGIPLTPEQQKKADFIKEQRAQQEQAKLDAMVDNYFLSMPGGPNPLGDLIEEEDDDDEDTLKSNKIIRVGDMTVVDINSGNLTEETLSQLTRMSFVEEKLYRQAIQKMIDEIDKYASRIRKDLRLFDHHERFVGVSKQLEDIKDDILSHTSSVVNLKRSKLSALLIKPELDLSNIDEELHGEIKSVADNILSDVFEFFTEHDKYDYKSLETNVQEMATAINELMNRIFELESTLDEKEHNDYGI